MQISFQRSDSRQSKTCQMMTNRNWRHKCIDKLRLEFEMISKRLFLLVFPFFLFSRTSPTTRIAVFRTSEHKRRELDSHFWFQISHSGKWNFEFDCNYWVSIRCFSSPKLEKMSLILKQIYGHYQLLVVAFQLANWARQTTSKKIAIGKIIFSISKTSAQKIIAITQDPEFSNYAKRFW